MTDTIDVCPECDQSSIETNSSRDDGGLPQYRCNRCGSTFDEPDKRERRATGDKVNGLAKELLDK
jgi:transposase-like protein